MRPHAFLKLPRAQKNAFPALVPHHELDFASLSYPEGQLGASVVLGSCHRGHWGTAGAHTRWPLGGHARKGRKRRWIVEGPRNRGELIRDSARAAAADSMRVYPLLHQTTSKEVRNAEHARDRRGSGHGY